MPRAFILLALAALAHSDIRPAAAQIVGGRTIRVSTRPLSPLMGKTTSVASTLDDNLVVIWFEERDGVNQAFAQRLDPWGHRIGGELPIAAPAGQLPRVAAAGLGFVAVWGAPDGTVKARCVGSTGVPGPPFTVGLGGQPDVASDANGQFVVAWTDASTQVLAQPFVACAAPGGSPIVVSPTSRGGLLDRAAVAVAPDGRFLVTWDETVGSQAAVMARRYDLDGTPAGAAFQVNDAPLAGIHAASIAPDGSFVVTWVSNGIEARRFDAAGNPVGPEFDVTGSPSTMPDVAHTQSGAFTIAYVAGTSVALRRYDAAGVAGAEVVAGPTYFPAGYKILAVAAQVDETVAVTWTHLDEPIEEVVLRRFGPLAAVSSAVDGNGVLEPGEDVTTAPTWLNGTGAPVTVTGAATAFAGPTGPGVTYGLLDATAAYGTIADGAAASCTTIADCYRAGVSAPPARPATHWDGRLDETVSWAGGTLTHRWPVHVGASFTDVPPASAYYRFAETILHAGVTGGCSGSAYCPSSSVTREQLAVFALRSRHEEYLSPACTGPFRRFDDVPASSPFCRWIEDLARRGVVAGCSPLSYCPELPVSREQMAVFMLATKEGPGYAPPACGTPVFADVPASSPFCPWIEELARRGVVAGCGGGNYCPAAPVSREQMAVFLSVTFGLSLLLP